MKIHNLRIGFATNSSSTHSIIILPEKHSAKTVRDIESDYDDCFGWESFRLASPELKMRYIAAQMVSGHREPNDVLDFAEKYIPSIKNKIQKSITNDEFSYSSDMSVDHQSVSPLFDNDDMIELVASDRVVICGGNDNGGETNHLPTGTRIDLSDSAYNRYVLKKEYGNYVFFSPQTGAKLRISLDDNSAYEKSITPELVDLKITDWCDVGCKFCYQSSTTAGKHASLNSIKKYIDDLSQMKVFEIAIGGGEPTSHPNFEEILKYTKSKGMIPNFTTLSSNWLDNEEVLKAVSTTVGGIGVSCSNRKSLELVYKIKKSLSQYYSNVTVMAQHVIGSVPLHVTAEFMNEANENNIPILLLGYKSVGFGKSFSRHDTVAGIAEFLQIALSKSNKVSISVDTAFLDQYPDLLRKLDIPHELSSSPEGKFSCYIDAVKNTMAKSSYVEENEMEPIPTSIEQFKQIYATY